MPRHLDLADPADREGIPFGPLEPATFLERPNRFLAHVELGGERLRAHVADPGRLVELLVPGRRVFVRRTPADPGRTTACRVVLVDHDGTAVCIDTGVPNLLVRHALERGRIGRFAAYREVRAEVRHGASRFDFALADPRPESGLGSRCFVEVKSVSWRRGEAGCFPDAVTARGRRHVEELTQLRREGVRTAVFFVCQRGDVSVVRPAADVDPDFAAALREAEQAGVEILAWRCSVSPGGVSFECEVPVVLA